MHLLLGALLSVQAEETESKTERTIRLCGIEGEKKSVKENYTMAILGNTRNKERSDAVLGRISYAPERTLLLLKDIQKAKPDCVSFLGDITRNGSKKEWKAFEENQLRHVQDIPILPILGDKEARKDSKYNNAKIQFPELGTDIGYNRVSSWYHYDIDVEGTVWRIIVLDGNKEELKSRWSEQLRWLDEIAQGEFDSAFVFLHSPWYNLAGTPPEMTENSTSKQLLDSLEESMAMMKLKGVFFGGGHANQVILPNGQYGTAFVGAGGGGAPVDDLYLWQPGEAIGSMDRIELESVFAQKLLKELDRWNGQSPLSQTTMNKAFNTGSYEGFPGLIDGDDYPVQGWWELTLTKELPVITYHHYYRNGDIKDIYQLYYREKSGWTAKEL